MAKMKARTNDDKATVLITTSFRHEGDTIPAGSKFTGPGKTCAMLISEGRACDVDDEIGKKTAKANADREKDLKAAAKQGAAAPAGMVPISEVEAIIAAKVAEAIKAQAPTPPAT